MKKNQFEEPRARFYKEKPFTRISTMGGGTRLPPLLLGYLIWDQSGVAEIYKSIKEYTLGRYIGRTVTHVVQPSRKAAKQKLSYKKEKVYRYSWRGRGRIELGSTPIAPMWRRSPNWARSKEG